MERSPVGKVDLVQLILGTLFFFVVVGIVCAPNAGNPYKLIALILLMGLLLFYGGIKKGMVARSHQQSFAWYKHPGILYSLALLLGVLPWVLLEDFVSDAVPNAPLIHDIGSIVFGTVMLGLVLAAVYFFFTQKTQGRRRQERMDEAAPLQRTARSSPQPKEAREEE